MKYRNLTDKEITTLQAQRCWAQDWKKVLVKDPFNPMRVQSTGFFGEVRLGKLEKSVDFLGGIEKSAGLYRTQVANCTLGDNVYIADVTSLTNYDIGDNAVIVNVGRLVVDGETSFGNGVELDVLNEGGGRTLRIYDELTAQIAYLMVLYRHNATLIKKLEKMVDAHVKERVSKRGVIGKGCRITHCTMIKNVAIGPYAKISGALRLQEGTIGSSKDAPVVVGEGVAADDFIILSGSKVNESAMLSSCFVGQGVKIGKQFSAENSVFFANCEAFHGEGCSVFAGPYTVTHHKSTLLIAGLFSFYNAGSGTNQSNHMYKLGPLHQGILERGCKTGSFSYLLWPARVGPFTAVIGKHYANFDTSNLPFSYINEVEGKSVITPAMNLFTVGTRRDAEKWPQRDRRTGEERLDLINFELFSPYTVGRMVKGSAALKELKETCNKKREYVNYNGININRLLLKSCCRYYEIGIKIFLGKCLLAKLGSLSKKASMEDLMASMAISSSDGTSDWIDVCGMMAPSASIEKTVGAVESGKIESLQQLSAKLQKIFDNYNEDEWAWCMQLISERRGAEAEAFSRQNLSTIIEDWRDNSLKLNNMIQKDASKEFDSVAAIGFGIDGGAKEKQQDFDMVRGTIEDNSFVKELREESVEIIKQANDALTLIEKL
jgi:acetyltransferase-like isoleucine patch superfamily enzyme